MREFRIDGSVTVAIVTGGASGLGEATARALAASGTQVVICDVAEARGKEVAASVGGRFCLVDVTDSAAIRQAVEVAESLGTLRLLVCCAGIGPPARVVSSHGEPVVLEHFTRVIGVNLIGTFDTIRQVAACMVRNQPGVDGERGVVVCTSSIAAFDGMIGQTAYSASKAGIVGMTLPLARDLSREGIRVVTIAPGAFDTPLLGALPDRAQSVLRDQVPFPSRLGRPEEFAALVEHIVANRMLNGEVIRLDGALRMPAR
jgi:NAD(P)-dependent dehydrogenase (short-subunit alcohol dehydrogenase family)